MQMYTDFQRMPFCEAMQSLVGKHVAVKMGMNALQGVLQAVYPDLLVLDVCQTPFYIRTEEVTWVSPLNI